MGRINEERGEKGSAPHRHEASNGASYIATEFILSKGKEESTKKEEKEEKAEGKKKCISSIVCFKDSLYSSHL